MKKGKVFFHPIEGTGSLTISWTSGPKGDAIEAKKGAGVGFFSEEGALLSVVFDEVDSSEDHQTLEFNCYRVGVTLKNGQVSYTLSTLKKPSVKHKKRRKRQSTKSKK
jgi:hypothetical protein